MKGKSQVRGISKSCDQGGRRKGLWILAEAGWEAEGWGVVARQES